MEVATSSVELFVICGCVLGIITLIVIAIYQRCHYKHTIVEQNDRIDSLFHDTETIFFSPSVINLATLFIRSGEPTDVPPNFNTFILLLLYLDCYYFVLFLFHHRIPETGCIRG